MKYFAAFILLLVSSNLYSNKPFSLWQLNGNHQIQFEKEECQYILKNDNSKKAWRYNKTDILTDEQGNLLYSFDAYYNKIVIRDANDNEIYEEIIFQDDKSNLINSIVLPFYDDNIFYYVFIATEDREYLGNMRFIRIDNSTSTPIIEQSRLIEVDLASNLLNATMSNNGDSYHIAVVKSNPNLVNPNLLHTFRLYPNGSYTSNSHNDLDGLNLVNVYAGSMIKFSPQGDKLVLNYTGSFFKFYSFDNATGDVKEEFEVQFNEDAGYNIRSIFEFSQDGKKFYSQSGHDNYIIHQFDLSNWGDKNAFLNSRQIIWETKASCVDCLFRDFQLSPNNKIYVSYLHSYTGRKDSTFLGVINCPNADAVSVGYEHLSIPITNDVIPNPHIQNIATNFLAEPQPAVPIVRPPNVIQYCEGTDITLEGVDSECGYHFWIKPNGERIYSNNLQITDFSAIDTGSYFYHFNNCYQYYDDTISVRMFDGYTPEIVLINPNDVDLCSDPIVDMKFTTTEKYDNYEWFITNPNSGTRTPIGNMDTIIVAEIGELNLIVNSDDGCTGEANYTIAIPNIEYDENLTFDIDLCRNADPSFKIKVPISSDEELRVDSINFVNSDMWSNNMTTIAGDYPDGIFDKEIEIGLDNSAMGVISDTMEIYISSNCSKVVRVAINVNVLTNSFALEIPHLKTEIGTQNFEIPIYLDIACLEGVDSLGLESTVSLSKHKYFIQDVVGVNVVNSWEDNQNTNIRFSYSSTQLALNSREKIGSLIGTVLLSLEDSTSVQLTDTESNILIDINNGSLVTENICIQDLRQVNILLSEIEEITIKEKIVDIKFHSEHIVDYNLEIIDYMGRAINNAVITVQPGDYSYQINLNGISMGLYFLRISNSYKSEMLKVFID